jgi:hypothetical protein
MTKNLATQGLPPLKLGTPNRPKAEAKRTQTNRKDVKAESRRVLAAHVEEVKAKVLDVIADQRGKATWSELRKRACKDQRTLGFALKSLMDAGSITGPKKEYPGWETTALYRVVKVKAQLKKAA